MTRTLFPMPPPLSETAIQAQIAAFLRLELGLRPFRANAAAFRGQVNTAQGLPDLFGCLPGGRMWAVEVKKPRSRRRANESKQTEVLDHLRAMGALVVVATSVLEARAAFEREGITTGQLRRT